MWHRVAALLGGRTITEWQQAMTHAEFVDWCAFYSLEPWGYEIDNWRTGVQAATVANAAGRKKPRKPSDFYPRPATEKRAKPAADIRRVIEIMQAKHDDG
jgi:hypothetical protein